FRRFHVIAAPGGSIVDLGAVPFDSVRELPLAGYVANSSGPDTTNPGVGKWYAYSMLSHLLMSKHHVYGVRTAAGDTPSSSCSRTTAGTPARRASRSGMLTRGTVPGASSASEEPPAVLGRGLASSSA